MKKIYKHSYTHNTIHRKTDKIETFKFREIITKRQMNRMKKKVKNKPDKIMLKNRP